MPLARLLITVVLATAVPLAGHAQTPPAAAASADQALVDGLVAAVNGRAADRQAWLARNVAARPQMPQAEFPVVLDSLAGAPGGLKLTSWSRRGAALRLLVSAGDRSGRVDLRLAADEPGKLSGMMVAAMPTPYPGPKLAAPVDTAALRAAIDRRVRFAADRDEFAGAVLVTKGDQVIYSGGFGEADRERRIPARLDTRFHLGSMDKQFTAVAIGQLIEQGKLGLDTRLIEVLPDYPNREAAGKINIRHLLSHSAGLGMMFERPGWQWSRRFASHAELLPLFAAEPLAFEPGARATYSNEGFAVLGAIVEKVSGRSWYDYVAEHIFRPAGMTHTGYPAADERSADRAVGYKFTDEDPLGLRGRRPNWDTLGRGLSFGGGYSTAGDMIRFLQALRAGKLLKPETAAQFVRQAPGGLSDYGLGFKVVPVAGRTIVGHDGGGPRSGVNSDAEIVWETGYAYAVMGNYDAPFAQTVGRDIGAMLAAQN